MALRVAALEVAALPPLLRFFRSPPLDTRVLISMGFYIGLCILSPTLVENLSNYHLSFT